MATTTQPASQASTQDARPVEVSPELLKSWLDHGDTVLVDVREDFEHAEERIAGAMLVPLSKFDAGAIRRAHEGKRVVFHCRSGKRSADAAGRFASGDEPVMHLSGGIEAWKSAGLPITRPDKPGLPIMRQVQIAAGALVVLGVVLGWTLWSGFLALALFVGCGLMFAGVTGWCGMAKLLALMPWNRRKVEAAASCCSA
ncbi:MAG: rhodanese-like domain-containing protein [Phycisphaerales bacterium JB037]